ncbi:galactokinase [Desulforhopalus sp. 52FAK]
MDKNITKIEEEICSRFTDEFESPPTRIIRSPGRVNLIGEHTDYNGGFVLPMAIDRYLVMAVKARKDNVVKVVSTDLNNRVEFSTDSFEKEKFSWGEYLKGCCWGLREEGHDVKGFEAVIASNIPVGASLSSSAALELATLQAFCYSSNIEWDPVAMALSGQRAENDWVGMNCGVMDQMICANGRKNHALLIDCRDIQLTSCPMPENSSIVILDTTTRRGLVDSAYNERRTQCFDAAAIMNVELLRDAGDDLLVQHKGQLSPLSYLRAKHIISENQRVLQAAEAMENGDGVLLGQLMHESHLSLRDDFEVSGNALDIIVECAMEHEACLGARMTGAGFAGCAVALVKKGSEQNFIQDVGAGYRKRMNILPQLYVCKASDGTSMRSV